jgi:DUF4097 and DUF4098 domain-containing protein YvlB
MRALLAVPLIASSLCLSACYIDGANWGERFDKDIHSTYPLKAGGRLTVETFNGSVEVSSWEQETVDISGTKFGATQNDADNLPVNIDATPDSVTIHVPHPALSRNAGARFVIKVPRNAVLSRITTTNGSIRIADGVGPARFKSSNASIHVMNFHGNVDAETTNNAIEFVNVQGDAMAHSTNGHIHVEELAGALDASTSNAGIQARLTRSEHAVRLATTNNNVELTLPPRFSSDVRVNTTNGAISLRLPEGTNARVQAHTSNAAITSEFDVRAQGEISRNHLNGVIGMGGPALDLDSTNGSIRLLRR